MQDQQHISNQQFAFSLIFSANKNLFINYARRSMSDEETTLNIYSSAFDRMDLGH